MSLGLSTNLLSIKTIYYFMCMFILVLLEWLFVPVIGFALVLVWLFDLVL